MQLRWLLFSGLFLLQGCLWPVRQKADVAVLDLASHPYDVAPTSPSPPMPPAANPAPADKTGNTVEAPKVVTDIQTTAVMMQAGKDDARPTEGKPKFKLEVPPELPGSEAPPLPSFKDLSDTDRERLIRRLFPELPPLPTEPATQPGPNGRPYTLADLQQLAAANSPALKQAATDVEAARGAFIQARMYPNPTVGIEAQPSNDNSTTGAWGAYFDQLIKTAGKLKLQEAAAAKDLENAVLALKRARSDLSTQVRNAYFGLLVAKETVRVTRALARFTDEVYRIHTGLLLGAQAAPYEPMALRSQAFTARLAYKQAISGYIYAWKQLVAAIGLHQLPLTAVEGRVDRFIPHYDYDTVLAHALRYHTDVLTARNGLDKARYSLKLAQVTPIPDFDLRVDLVKEFSVTPYTYYHTVQLAMPIPIWDQNRGNIIAGQAALARATEEPHRVELALTTTLATAYTGYKQNLDALEYYRRYILPDQVRAYRGIHARRQVDPNAAFGDLVSAQQTLAMDVTNYLGILGSLWSSVVSVADLLQTDDLFQMGKPLEVPELPNLDDLAPWPCGHPQPVPPPAGVKVTR